jgi:hypothetical protein
VLLVMRWKEKRALEPRIWLAIALVAIAALHAAAVAYSRGAGLPDGRPLSRYQDALLLGVAGHGVAAAVLVQAQARRARLVAIGWYALLAGGLVGLTVTNLTIHVPAKRARDAAGLAVVREYLATGDAQVFALDAAEFIHPDPAVVRRLLDDPTMRPVLTDMLAERSPMNPPPALVRRSPVLALTAALALALVVALGLRSTPVTAEPGS